ncbi:MAG: N-acetyltransferase [Pseudohongiellaceae bacterium]
MKIREETAADYAAVAKILNAAFEADAESRLVSRLRISAKPLISLVAERDGQVIGHILFSPVTLDTDSSLPLMGLAPMAVLPQYQRRGVGSALVEAGLAACRRAQIGAVVVLGHPAFYAKFGFLNSSVFEIKSDYDVPADVFMLIEMQENYLSGHRGTAQYLEKFESL